MVIIHLSGGFGNQLFSYAFGCTVAKMRGQELWIDSSIQDEEWFFRNPDILEMEITYDKRLSYGIKRDFLSRAVLNRLRFHHAIGFSTPSLKEEEMQAGGVRRSPGELLKLAVEDKHSQIYLRRNWQREEFFAPCKEEIARRFRFKAPLPPEAQELADKLSGKKNTVAVHVRRGDYVRIGVAPSPAFFKDAMAQMAELLDSPEFHIFSEDPAWAKESFKDLPYSILYPEYEAPDDAKGILDFRLISSARHQIISNSSYS